MTATTDDLIRVLTAHDMMSEATRLMLADLLAEDGREDEEALCRHLFRGVTLHGGRVVAVVTGSEAAQAVLDYCHHHEVEEDDVLVETLQDEAGQMIGFRLSLDVDGRSRGCGESFGAWN